MIRHTLTAALLAGALLAPQVAEAQQYPAQQPLNIFCTSLAQEFCMSFLTWVTRFNYWDEDNNRVDDPYLATAANGGYETKVQAYGSGLESSSVRCCSNLSVKLSGPGVFEVSALGTASITGPGYYRYTDSGGARTNGDADVEVSTPYDVASLSFGWFDDVYQGCYPGDPPATANSNWGKCVEVPEPTALPLLAAGLFGLGFVAWRRRDETEHLA